MGKAKSGKTITLQKMCGEMDVVATLNPQLLGAPADGDDDVQDRQDDEPAGPEAGCGCHDRLPCCLASLTTHCDEIVVSRNEERP